MLSLEDKILTLEEGMRNNWSEILSKYEAREGTLEGFAKQAGVCVSTLSRHITLRNKSKKFIPVIREPVN